MADPLIIGDTASAIAAGKKAKEAKTPDNNLGKDQFLKILIAQLKNQDPTQPLQDKEFIAQMAQFTSVEQLTNISTEMKLLRQSLGVASDLIGKSISWEAADESGKKIIKSGVVDSITFKENKQYATVQGVDISLDQLLRVEDVKETP
ncbi:Basal-body rod modification protein FlgD [compost metagenome]